MIKDNISYSHASQSQHSLYTDSDLDLNSDLLYSDIISDLISGQTPLTPVSRFSSLTAPPSLLRVGPCLQQYWVLYSNERGSDID